jgi:hypothetical protein
MPYARTWIPAVAAVAHVIRADGCDRSAAMRQIESAVLEGALRWARRGRKRWDWDAEVLQADLVKLWPQPPDEADSVANMEAAALAGDLREGLERAREWHDQPVPDRPELRRLLEMLAILRSMAEREIKARDEGQLSSDRLQQELRQAEEDIHAETLSRFGRGQLAAFLETSQGLERLPYGSYWLDAGGRASELARRALTEGAAPSNRHSGLSGAVMVHAGEFQAFADEYLTERGSTAEPPSAGRFNHPVWDLRDVIGWVLDRDPAKFGRIHSVEDARSAVHIALFYNSWPRNERDPNALTTILHALQRGELVAHQAKSALPREHWGGITERGLRFAIRDGLWFWREDVLTLWPVEAAALSQAPPSIQPIRVSSAVPGDGKPKNRAPNWALWKHIPAVKIFEAVALSLNIEPSRIRHSPNSWMADKRLFDESDEFKDRLFVVERNLEKLGVVNFANVQYFNEDPVVGLPRFAVWAVSLGWSLPSELVDIATHATVGSPPVVAREATTAAHPRGNTESILKRANQSRGGRKKGSGAIDDAPRLRAMLDLLVKGQAPSVHDAARKIAASMSGTSQSRDADINRLRGKFAKAYGTEPSEGKTWRDVAAELNGN